MKLSDLFTKDVVTADPEDSLASIARTMQERNVGTVVIVRERRPVGILTDRDLALALGARGFSLETPAQQAMTPHVIAIPEDTGIFTATKYMRDCGVRRLPLVDRQDQVVGMVSLDDLLRCLGRELYNLAEGIRHEAEVKPLSVPRPAEADREARAENPPSWVRRLLRLRGIPFEELHHLDAYTAQEVAEREHFSGHHVAKVVVVLADGRPVELVLPASRHVDLERVRTVLHAHTVRLATEKEMEQLFTDCEVGAVPPLRHWKNVDVILDRSLKVEGDILFQAGTHADAIRLSFRDWYELVNPQVATFGAPAELAQS